MNIGETLKQKVGPLPIWVWALMGTAALAIILIRKKNQNANQTQAAADQSNSNLGSAAELANMFQVAGLMPYQGGDVYVNTTTTENPPSTPTTPTQPGGGTPGGGHKPPTRGPGKWVTIGKWNSKNAPWNSTVWGITNHLLGSKVSWRSVWNAPENAHLRAMRKRPEEIQPGDKIFVPGAK